MGKWSHLVGKYPEKPENPSSDYQRALMATRDKYRDFSTEELANALTEAEKRVDEVNDQLSEAKLQVTAIESLFLFRLKEQGIESVVAGGFTHTVSPEPQFAKRDARLLRQWAIDTQQEDLLTINSQTLTNLAKTYFEEHNEAPPGVELTNIYTKLLRRKKK